MTKKAYSSKDIISHHHDYLRRSRKGGFSLSKKLKSIDVICNVMSTSYQQALIAANSVVDSNAKVALNTSSASSFASSHSSLSSSSSSSS
eukprot:CAMPEP_0175076514 /NCGR_PEP_ID=MMETSP0052_2-20121109/22776_1 /TAXON_ID=51329 ORGANISM="Polytomella parva, Strain SAG 63-3" /NCGR_SAMPLE_ID=MMETSP0052_2 /ASSEMBLY_ACC=CAM_ASM_000194 /LENGTH=89 /DNA_ID=CAMNT_0016345675 /DNA_START=36 /DNA_END=302 /DNA_ORIENTATION=-